MRKKDKTDANAASSKQQKQSASKCSALTNASIDNEIENLFREIKTSKKKRQHCMDPINSSEQQSMKRTTDHMPEQSKSTGGRATATTGGGKGGESYGRIKSEYGDGFIVSPEAPLERIDAESGLPVYKAHILRVGEGGGTALCPFDCDCCF